MTGVMKMTDGNNPNGSQAERVVQGASDLALANEIQMAAALLQRKIMVAYQNGLAVSMAVNTVKVKGRSDPLPSIQVRTFREVIMPQQQKREQK